MKETIHKFGPNEGLIGTITHPIINQNDKLPALILWNAGMIHRAGAYRMNVDLARKVADLGFYAFRFDMSRKGDSKKELFSKTFMHVASLNVQEAMDFINEKTGVSKFILFGLCSGADQLHPIAKSDERVNGAILLDGYGYRTYRYFFHHLKYYYRRIYRIIQNPRKESPRVQKKLNNLFLRAGGNLIEEDVLTRSFPTINQAKADIIEMVNNGKKLLYIYTGGVPEYYNYESQFEDMFKIKLHDYNGSLQVKYYSEANHIYTFLEDRYELFDTITQWLKNNY